MSQAREGRRAETWESQHKGSHEKTVGELQEMKKQLDSMESTSDEYKALKTTYDARYKAAEDFFVKYYES